MRLDVIKHRRVSLKVPSDAADAADNHQANADDPLGLRQRRKMRQTLRISLSDSNQQQNLGGAMSDQWPAPTPFSAAGEWRRRALDGQLAVEEINRWISSGDIVQLETLVLAGRADLLLGEQHKENFIFGHSRAKAFLKELPAYKEKYDIFLQAIVEGDEPTVHKLMDFRHLMRARHPRTMATTMHLAAIYEHPTILRTLLDHDGSHIDARDSEGRTALHYAAALAGTLREDDADGSGGGGDDKEKARDAAELECFDILLDSGANESLLDVEGYSPINFHRMSRLIDMDQVRGLNRFPLRAGDRVDKLITDRDVPALRDIVLAGDYHSQISERIFPPESRDLATTLAHLQMRISAIHEAIRDDDQMTLKQLVDDWDTATGRDQHGRTPLHIAVLHGRARAARYLLLMFPRCVNLTDKASRSPLHYASCLTDDQQRAQMTRILCRAGAESAATKRHNENAAGRHTEEADDMLVLNELHRRDGLIGEEAEEEEDEDEGGGGDVDQSADEIEFGHVAARRSAAKAKNAAMIKGKSVFNTNRRRSTLNGTNALSDSDEVDNEVESRVLAINFGRKEYRELEQLHFEGQTGEVWRVVKKHLGNEALIKYIYAYRQAQSRLTSAFSAIEANDMRKMKSLVDDEIVQSRDSRGLTPLHVAVLKERHQMVEYIGQTFADFINIADHLGRTAAHYAAPQQNAIYDTLADHGANTHIADKNGFTAARYRQHPEQMVKPLPLVSSGGSAEGTRATTAGGTVRRGTVDYRRTQLRHHRDPSMDDSNGTMVDPDAPSDEQVKRWLTIGEVPQLEQIVLDGRAHLLADKTSTNLASAEFLQGVSQYQSKIDAIHKAVEEGDVRRVKSLIDRNSLATARDTHGMTPLHKALLYGQTNTVRFLLAKYPHCVNEADHAGRTALHYAAADTNGEHMIKVLQKAGGDAFIEDRYGHTPFFYRTHGKRLNIRTLKDNAVINHLIAGQLNRTLLQDLEEDITDWVHTGNIGKLEELVLNGYADLLLGRNHQVEDAEAISFLEVLPQYQAKIHAIHKAIEQGNLRAVKLLTDRKKLALCRDGRGLAPLHKSIVFGQTDIAKYLIRNYPQSVNAMDQSKRTPLHYAAALRDGGYMYKLMRKAGADPNIFDCHGRPPKYYLRYPGEINLERMRMDTKQALKQVLHNRVAPSYLESNIQQWLREGNLAKLDQLVLSGCGDLLLDKKSSNSAAHVFLNELPNLLNTIDSIHKAVKDGQLELVKGMMTGKRLALARDRHGCTPLHTAIIHERSDIIRFIAATYPNVLNAPDYNKRTAMHYAAAARDGGHYLKILGKAGADPMAVDNEGRAPDYYRRNTVFDLKLLKERDVEEVPLEDSLIPPGGHVPPDEQGWESPVDSFSPQSSGVDTGRRDGDDEEEDMEKRRFERLLHEKLDMPTSDNGLYLARTVAPVLTKALAEVLLRRPANPIGFVSEWLVRYIETGEDY
ncbi:hypothetical protein niasHT_023571 [Heterodera trifolii]|uniref:ANK_REP_REGION domain-containing protein n=1 Tax=Heterodera trifolii TaxID=157864 RepID=A0ABD2JF18_9BILA